VLEKNTIFSDSVLIFTRSALKGSRQFNVALNLEMRSTDVGEDLEPQAQIPWLEITK
jgi:hypothetical protein